MILTACHLWIAGLWIVFLVYWAIAALFTKATLDRGLSRKGTALRVLMILGVILATSLARRSAFFQDLQADELYSIPMALAGAVIATAGAAFAFAARAAIGRNWGTPGSRKANSDLVTHGPYGLVRHPIYSGILLLMIGTAVGLMPTWWLVVIPAGAYFLYSARREEALMAERFPDTYPAYRARTKMLLPFLI